MQSLMLIVFIAFFCYFLYFPDVHGVKQTFSGKSRFLTEKENRIRVKRTTRGRCSQFAPCSCRSRRTVECSKLDCLQHLPTQNMSRHEGVTITKITVTRQHRFTKVSDIDLASLPNLKMVRFFNNKIYLIHEHAFDRNQKLEELDLHRNSIIMFPTAISQLPELRKLNLGRNKINSIPLDAFENNPKLEQLILRRNSFVNFPDCYFSRSLVKLSLGVNHISNLLDLRYLVNLKVLRLESNSLRSINSRALPESLVELRLCNNSLSDEISFDNLGNLRRLRLASNPGIRNIRHNSFFHSQSRLVELDLRECGINHIDALAFSCFPFLRIVELQGNNLSEYDPEWFAHNRKIKRISFSRNPWNCDCNMQKHLAKLKLAANATNRLHMKRSIRNLTFDNDFENITCAHLSRALSRRGGAAGSKLDDVDSSSCLGSSERWRFKSRRAGRNACSSRLLSETDLSRALVSPRVTSTTTLRPTTRRTSSPTTTSNNVVTTTFTTRLVTDTSSTTTLASTTTSFSFPTTTTTSTFAPFTTKSRLTTTRKPTTTSRPTTTSSTTPKTTTSTTSISTTTTTTTENSAQRYCSLDGECICPVGGRCVSPFTYEGVEYDQACATTEGWTRTYQWCYTNLETEAYIECEPC